MRFFFLLLLSLATVSVSQANILNTECTMDASGNDIQGVNNESPYTIASVTKVFTSHWAVARLGANFRFQTLVHVTPVAAGFFDVHLQGGRYPYFDRNHFQFLVGELNRIGVKAVRYLTYDENFVYASDMRTNAMLAHSNQDITSADIMKDLRDDTGTINSDLTAFNAKVLALENMALPKTLTWSVRDIHPLLSSDFERARNTRSFSFKSVPLYRILKEMNRNSHNLVSEILFLDLSDSESYKEFVLSRTDIPANQITLLNGSGYPILSGSAKLYNRASCAAVLRVMSDLRNLLKNESLDFKDIVPVAGKDADGDGNSTVTQIYGDPKTNGTLLGKTGTVSNTIALGGMVSTDELETFFYTSYTVEPTFNDRDAVYKKIKEWIITWLIGERQKSDLDQYRPKAFLPFDINSRLSDVTTQPQLP